MDLPYLRNFRRRSVMSQEQLAERSGVARDTISKLETGRRKAYPSTIRKLAAGLEVEPQLLLGGVEYVDEAPEDGGSPKHESSPVETANSSEPRRGSKKIGFRSGE